MVIMIRNQIFAAALIAAVSAPAFAQDLESILDEADKSNQATSAKASAPKAYSALYYVLQSKIPNPHPDQSHFIQLVEAAEWDKALLQYPVAFEGMPVTGLELLFRVEEPGQIHSEIRRLWKDAASNNHPAWGLANITWKPGF